MDYREKINSWLNSLNPTLNLNENEICAFTYQGLHCEIELSGDQDFIYFISPLL